MQSNETTTHPTLEELKAQPHYSYSALNTYLNICGLQYRYRYVDRLEAEQTPVALPFGSAFHAALSEQARAGAATPTTGRPHRCSYCSKCSKNCSITSSRRTTNHATATQ